MGIVADGQHGAVPAPHGAVVQPQLREVRGASPREHLERSRRVEEDRRWTAGAAGTNDDDSSGDDDDEEEMMDADDLADGLAAAFNTGQGVGGVEGGDDDVARATSGGHTEPDDDGAGDESDDED